MRDHAFHAGRQCDLDDRLVVLQIDAAGRLQHKVMLGAGLGYVLVFVLALQAAHREIFDGAAAHVLQQGDGGFHRHDAVRRCGTQWAGRNLHPADAAGRRYQAVDHAVVLAQQRAAGADAGKHLVNVLRLHLLSDQADHRRLLRIAGAQADRQRVVDQARIAQHVGHRAVDVRVVLGEHAHQHMAFRRGVDLLRVGFGAGQHVQADAVAIVVRLQLHACFSVNRFLIQLKTVISCCSSTLRTSTSILPSLAL